MKRLSPLALAGVAALFVTGLVHADPVNLTVTSMKKRFDVERKESVDAKMSYEKWGYSITIENKSFKNLEDLEVQYRQYMLDEVIKGDPRLKAFTGSTKIGNLPNTAKFKFDTEPVTIEKKALKANWYYTNGGSSKQKDNVAGYWLKIFSGGNVIYEVQYPPEFKAKMTW